MDEISLDEVGPLVRGRTGLILGPGATRFPGCFRGWRDAVAVLGGVLPAPALFATTDAALDTGAREADLVARVGPIPRRPSEKAIPADRSSASICPNAWTNSVRLSRSPGRPVWSRTSADGLYSMTPSTDCNSPAVIGTTPHRSLIP